MGNTWDGWEKMEEVVSQGGHRKPLMPHGRGPRRIRHGDRWPTPQAIAASGSWLMGCESQFGACARHHSAQFGESHERIAQQKSLLVQALQGFAVPDGEDKQTKWKTYAVALINAAKHS